MLLRNLLDRIAGTTTDEMAAGATTIKVGDGEEVIGELSLELRQFSTILGQDQKKLLGLVKQFQQGMAKESIMTVPEFMQLKDRLERNTAAFYDLQKAFWAEVRASIPPTSHNLGLREGWKIVTLKEEGDGEECDCPTCRDRRDEIIATLLAGALRHQ
jgi:hypothetical protein